jgi:putative two-component system response regulator
MDSKVKILVVDDEKEFLISLEDVLSEELGAQILTAENAADAMEIAVQEYPTLIICDYYMPGEDGFSFCKKIKSHKELGYIPFIILTSASELNNLVRGLDTGADDYITKPFQVEELLSRVRAHIRVGQLKQELRKDKLELERLNKELEEGLFGAIDLLTQLIGLRVPNATARARRAAALAEWMGTRLNLDDEKLQYTSIAASLHEIGKIQLNDELLKKEPHILDETDKKKLDQFPVFGHLIVSTIPQLRKVALYLRYQMENYDGTGYPDRLLREEIPLPARMLRGINVIEALAIQPEMSTERMVSAIQKMRSTVLDPRISQMLVEYIQKVQSNHWQDNKQEVGLFELQEGMIIAEDICTGSGVKLLNKDTKITIPIIERLLSHNGVDPILNTIYRYREEVAGNN